jgi:3-hydroxyacyl-CoA dehydrogenase
MLEKGLTGEKAGQGFYKRVKQADGSSAILTIDLDTLEYRERQPAGLPSLEEAASITDVHARVRALFLGQDKVGSFLRETLAPTLVYTAAVTPSIAFSPDDVDRVLRWGFAWDMGPFELIDAIGIQHVIDATRETSPDLLEHGVPPLLQAALDQGRDAVRTGDLPPAAPDLYILRAAKQRSAIIKQNPGARLVDLGDGVLCVEFHSKMNIVGGDTIEMLHAGVQEASRNFSALVVGNDAQNFSAGANLMLVLLEAQEEHWEEIDLMVSAFQQATLALRYADVPVIVAPAGLALGGGCEVLLHADRVQAAGETYTGLVEVGVGLIPAAGGTKEMVARASEGMPRDTSDYLPPVQRVFETIAFAKVSASAPDAERLGYLRPIDAVTMNRERLMADAKSRALHRVSEGYSPPAPRHAIRVGGDTVSAPLKLGIHLARWPDQRPRCGDRSNAGHSHGRRRIATSVDGHRAAAP